MTTSKEPGGNGSRRTSQATKKAVLRTSASVKRHVPSIPGEISALTSVPQALGSFQQWPAERGPQPAPTSSAVVTELQVQVA